MLWEVFRAIHFKVKCMWFCIILEALEIVCFIYDVTPIACESPVRILCALWGYLRRAILYSRISAAPRPIPAPKIAWVGIPDITQSPSRCLLDSIAAGKEGVPRYLVFVRKFGVVNWKGGGCKLGNPSSGWVAQCNNDSFFYCVSRRF